MQIETTAATTARTTAAAKKGVGQDLDSFLHILTTQLQNQDPLAPMDADKFTSQLVQFSTVEQAILSNQKLDNLVSLLRSSGSSNALDYVGSEVDVDGGQIVLDPTRGADIRFSLEQPAEQLKIRIFDQKGNIVQELDGGAAEGPVSTVWNGKEAGGTAASAGVYKVAVTARDANGKTVPVTLSHREVVEAVETASSGLVLVVDGARVPFESVRLLTRATAASD